MAPREDGERGGAVLGAGIGALAELIDLSFAAHVLVVGALLAGGAVWSSFFLLPENEALAGGTAASGAEAVKAARAAGASEVLVAGPEKLFADAEGDARPDGYLTMNIDAVAELSRLLDSLGA